MGVRSLGPRVFICIQNSFLTRLKGNVLVVFNGCGKLRRCVAVQSFWEAMLAEWCLAILLTAYFLHPRVANRANEFNKMNRGFAILPCPIGMSVM